MIHLDVCSSSTDDTGEVIASQGGEACHFPRVMPVIFDPTRGTTPPFRSFAKRFPAPIATERGRSGCKIATAEIDNHEVAAVNQCES